MKNGRRATSGAGWGVLALVLAATASSGQERPLVVTGGWWFDVDAGEMRPNRGIVSVGGRLLAVGDADTPVDLTNAERIELDDDRYVLPGLIDLHAHYNVQFLGLPRREELVATPVLWLANGVTATFPAGEYDPEGMLRLRREIDAGLRPGPRVLTSGPYFGRTRPGWTPLSRDSIFAEVDHWAAQGAVGFKAKGADPRTVRWLVERAHRHGLTVRRLHAELLAGLGIHPVGELRPRHVHDELVATVSIRIVHRNLGGLLVADGHPDDGLFEARNDHTIPQGQLEWVTIPGGIEGGSVRQAAGVVNVYCVALLGLGHGRGSPVSSLGC